MLPLGTIQKERRTSLHRRRERGLTLYELLAIIVTIFCVVLLTITLFSGRHIRANYRIACAGNLKEIGKLASMYADSASNGFFPFGEGDNPRAHESLNRMIAFHGSARKVPPKVFICPTWREGDAAVPGEDNHYRLDANTNAYAWIGTRLKPMVFEYPFTDSAPPLASDKYHRHDDQLNGHDGGMNVLYTDMAVIWIPATDLPPDNDGLPEGLVR